MSAGLAFKVPKTLKSQHTPKPKVCVSLRVTLDLQISVITHLRNIQVW